MSLERVEVDDFTVTDRRILFNGYHPIHKGEFSKLVKIILNNKVDDSQSNFIYIIPYISCEFKENKVIINSHPEYKFILNYTQLDSIISQVCGVTSFSNQILSKRLKGEIEILESNISIIRKGNQERFQKQDFIKSIIECYSNSKRVQLREESFLEYKGKGTCIVCSDEDSEGITIHNNEFKLLHICHSCVGDFLRNYCQVDNKKLVSEVI
jgi:hypothetical protein